MAEDIIKTIGATKASKSDAGGGVLRSEPVLAIVKNNIDPVKQGRIQVWINDLSSSNQDDSSSWVTVGYMSNFYGKTLGSATGDSFGNYGTNPVSYGEWHSPPDIGTTVVCIFINGDPNYGYYIGSVPEPEALTMVPAIGSVTTKVTMNEGEAKGLAGAVQLPVTNINSDNTNLADSNGFLESPKPVHSYVASVLSQQGLIRDTVRGTITSSSQRETPSRVGWGVSTPGRPIYEGGYTDQTIVDAALGSNPTNTKIVSRRPGHTFVMDDGDILGKDQLIRLRTSLGHQILMSDDGQCLFIIHANGQTWIELGKEGTIDMYATNSVNVRTQGDLNLHADNNINIQSNKNINIKAKENITINSDKDYSLRVAGSYKQQTLGDHTLKVNGQLSQQSAGDASLASSGSTFINGAAVNLNTGAIGLTPGEIKPLVSFVQTDTLFDSEKGFIPAPGKLETITSRAPAHHPWINAGQGVPVDVKLDAAANLPPEPSTEVENTNEVVPATPETPTEAPLVSTVPESPVASETLGVGTTSALVSATAVSAAATVTENLQTAGTAIVNGQAAVGQLAQTATQMVTGGVLKPGSETLVNGLIQAGASVQGAMTSNMFTGLAGTKDLTSFVSNTTAQVTSMVTNIQSAQSKLTATGLISGNESPLATGGLILSAVQNGVGSTVDFVKNIGSGAGNIVAGISSSFGKVADSISAGNFASSLSLIESPLGGIKDAASSLINKVKSPVTAAFDAVKDAYKSFKPNVPQDLTALAVSNTEAETAEEYVDPYEGLTTEQIKSLGTSDASDPFVRARLNLPPLGGKELLGSSINISSAIGGVTSSIGNITGSLTSGIGSVTSGIGNIVGSLTGGLPAAGLGSITSVVSNATSSALSAAQSLNLAKTGLQGISGGQSSLSLVVNNISSTINTIPGVSTLGAVINNNASAALNGISPQLMSGAKSISQALGTGSLGSILPAGSSPTGALGSVLNNLGATAGNLSTIAGGLSLLPGSLGNAAGTLNTLTSGLSALSSGNAAGALSTLAGGLNSLSGGLPSIQGLDSPAGILSSLQDNLKNNSNSLVGLASSVLSPALAGQLSAAVNSVATSNPGKLQVPVVATNTVDRSSITGQLTSILGNSKIPPPTYGGSLTNYFENESKKLEESRKRRDVITKQIEEQKALTYKIRDEYQDAINNYPPDSPEIVEQREKYYAAKKKWLELVEQFAKA